MTTVRARIAAAAHGVGRAPEDVTLIAVTKTFPPAAVVDVARAGCVDVGENYVQEGRDKRAAVGTESAGLTWHLIGGLQRNKVRTAVATFDRIHTIDSVALGTAVDAAATALGRTLPVLLQVNVAHDTAKRGADPTHAASIARDLLACHALRLDGLMTIGPLHEDPTAVRAHFRALRQLRDELAQQLGVEMPHLSMGMSDDFEIAVEEGATMIRVGRVLLGERQSGPWREGA